jgi:putative membrane protein
MNNDPDQRSSAGSAPAGDASRRTRLATERTQLAWWRTGLTALAVGIAIGRVLPELGEDPKQWPYAALGAGFALYGVLLIWYGGVRAAEVERAVAEGRFAMPVPWINSALGVIGIGLGLATGVLIVAG